MEEKQELAKLNNELLSKNKELEKVQKQLEMIYNSTTDCMALVSVESATCFRLISFNDAYWKTVVMYCPELSREQLIDQDIRFIGELLNLSEGMPSNICHKFEQAYATKAKYKEVEVVLHGGQTYYFDSTCFPIFDDQEKCTHILYTTRDVTERKQAEEALRKSEDFLKTIYNNSELAMFVVSVRGFGDYVYEGVNKLHEKLFDIANSDIVGKTPEDFVYKFGVEGVEYICNIYDECVRTGNVHESEIELEVDGRDEWFLSKLTPVYDVDGKVYRIIGFCTNITDSKQMETRLRHAEKMQAIGQLAGGIAHDFNNQLAGIAGFTEIVRDKLKGESKLSHCLDSVMLCVKRSADLTSQLLAYSRKGKVLSVIVDMHHIVNEVINLLSRIVDKRISIHRDLKAESTTVMGDPSQLQNVVLNLALNARDAMPDGGELLFTTENIMLGDRDVELDPGEYLLLQVNDTGEGMDEKTKEKIFEPFFTTKKQGKGTGMGLAAVYGTVNSHKGMISVDSELGKGSVFKLYFPICSQEKRAKSFMIENKPLIEEGGHLLLVEDEEIISEAIGEILKDLGYKVSACCTGREAVDFYKQNWKSIDLVIMDIMMPQLGGVDAFKAMKEINQDVAVLISSGYSQEGDAQSLLDNGAKGFLKKPFTREELIQKVLEALKG